jgi:hypothetical protein
VNRLQRGAVTFCGSVLAVLACLTGCADTSAGIGAALSVRLQNDVQQVAELAAARRYPEAATALAALRRTARSSVASGSLSPERATRIQAAVDVVAADLKEAQPAMKPPAPTPARPTTQPSAATTATLGATTQQHERVQKWLEHWKKRAQEARHRGEHEKQQHDDNDD